MDTVRFNSIRPTLANARTIQRLDMELLASYFKRPTQFANPDGVRLVARQLDELNRHPELFTGAYVDGRLSGYMRIGDWTEANDIPYIVPQEARARDQQGSVAQTQKFKLGIFGLAVSLEIDRHDADMIAEDLLESAVTIATDLGHSAVNIGLYDQDPLQPTAMQQGFRFTGHINEPLRRTGVLQRLYSKPLDS